MKIEKVRIFLKWYMSTLWESIRYSKNFCDWRIAPDNCTVHIADGRVFTCPYKCKWIAKKRCENFESIERIESHD